MKIVVISQPLPPLIYGINRLYTEGWLTEAVIERTPDYQDNATPRPPLWKSVVNNFRAEGLTGIMAGIGRIAERRRQAQAAKRQALEAAEINRQYFNGLGERLLPDVPHRIAASVNEDSVYERICELQPDVLLIHGTTVVKKRLMQAVPLALNIHTGLSPWYKGVGSVAWALINGDVNNIGVTLHKLSSKLDGGDIVGQRRIVVHPNDTLNTIKARLHVAGIDMAIKAFQLLKDGKNLEFHPQDESQALLIRGFLFSDELYKHVDWLERRGMIARMCAQPSRNYYFPIVEF